MTEPESPVKPTTSSPLIDCEAEIHAILERHKCAIVPILVVKQVGRGLPSEALISTEWRIVQESR